MFRLRKQGNKQAKRNLTEKVLPVEIAIGEGEDFHGIINLFSERAHIYKSGTTTGEYEETDIPEELLGKFEQWETELQETVAVMRQQWDAFSQQLQEKAGQLRAQLAQQWQDFQKSFNAQSPKA